MADKHSLNYDVRELKLGASFTNNKSSQYHTIKYDFKPASVDVNKMATVDVGINNQVTVTVPHLDGAGVPQTVFKGSQRPYAKECVLIIDRVTGEITLEKLSSNIQVKKTRQESAQKPRPLTPVTSELTNTTQRSTSRTRVATNRRTHNTAAPAPGSQAARYGGAHKTPPNMVRSPQRVKTSPPQAAPWAGGGNSTLASLPMIGLDELAGPAPPPAPAPAHNGYAAPAPAPAPATHLNGYATNNGYLPRHHTEPRAPEPREPRADHRPPDHRAPDHRPPNPQINVVSTVAPRPTTATCRATTPSPARPSRASPARPTTGRRTHRSMCSATNNGYLPRHHAEPRAPEPREPRADHRPPDHRAPDHRPPNPQINVAAEPTDQCGEYCSSATNNGYLPRHHAEPCASEPREPRAADHRPPNPQINVVSTVAPRLTTATCRATTPQAARPPRARLQAAEPTDQCGEYCSSATNNGYLPRHHAEPCASEPREPRAADHRPPNPQINVLRDQQRLLAAPPRRALRVRAARAPRARPQAAEPTDQCGEYCSSATNNGYLPRHHAEPRAPEPREPRADHRPPDHRAPDHRPPNPQINVQPPADDSSSSSSSDSDSDSGSDSDDDSAPPPANAGPGPTLPSELLNDDLCLSESGSDSD
ncbi:ell-associated factor Eaf [Cydia pomonella]|uniref:ell-associated factor Eaf n=1 Tax=Cydia pomonella TaxID=82600 RepID=UPI002ADDB691|nr:ell-associated factor Eaf [Cydia pomonella]